MNNIDGCILEIIEVENGFVVSQSSYDRSLYSRRWVANTPRDLGMLIEELAKKKKTKKKEETE